jgi:hypothetical protein
MSLKTEDRWVITTIIFSFTGVASAALLKTPFPIGISVFIIITILFLAWFKTNSPRLGWLLLCGFIAGFGELWSDWIHVEYFRSLVYLDYFGFKILASPSYMPFGWWLTVVQFGYIALRLTDRYPVWISIAIPTFLGMCLPPWYEQFAAPARAWHYTPHGIMISNTPLWVIFTYGGCLFSVASASVSLYNPQAHTKAILAGFFISASFLFSSVFWFSLLG